MSGRLQLGCLLPESCSSDWVEGTMLEESHTPTSAAPRPRVFKPGFRE